MMAVDKEFEGFKYAYKINLDWDNTATKVIRLVGKNKSVLEFGCGPGHMSKVLVEKMGCTVTGIEMDVRAAQHAERYCRRVYNVDLDQADIPLIIGDEQFDVLLFADILEHLKAPDVILQKVRPLIKDRGYIVASVPNISYCGVIAELLTGRFDYRETGILDRSHLRFYVRNGIVRLFADNGYRVDLIEDYILSPEYSEFLESLNLLPDEVYSVVMTATESLVYQYIIRAETVY